MCRKLKFSAILMFCMLALSVLSVHTVHAANTNKKTLTGTIGGKNFSFKCEFKLTKEANLNTQIKILALSGKGKKQKIYWVPYYTNKAKGSLFYDFNPSQLKKNKTLKPTTFSQEAAGSREGGFTFHLPEGYTKMKIRVTISTTDGKKSIQSFKKTIYPVA